MTQSEIARLREQIALEYQATQRLFTDFTPTARHEYISKRQENIGAYYEELTRYMPAQEAIALVVETINAIQSPSSSLPPSKSESYCEISVKKESAQ